MLSSIYANAAPLWPYPLFGNSAVDKTKAPSETTPSVQRYRCASHVDASLRDASFSALGSREDSCRELAEGSNRETGPRRFLFRNVQQWRPILAPQIANSSQFLVGKGDLCIDRRDSRPFANLQSVAPQRLKSRAAKHPVPKFENPRAPRPFWQFCDDFPFQYSCP